MFTGIITDLGRLRTIRPGGDTRLVIETAYDTSGIEIGASIACSGICLTVVETGADCFAVDVSAETLSRTTLGTWQPGYRINLERSLRLGDELGGHLVSGHVDATAEILKRWPEGDSQRFVFGAPAEVARFVASKGSVALDGVSLTINEVQDEPSGKVKFGVNIIPHTAENTSFGSAQPGQSVNLEIDMLARYVQRQLGRQD